MTMCSMLSEQTQAGEETLLAIGLSQSEITLLDELAEQHHFRVLVANADCDLSSIPAFATIANPQQLAKDRFDLLLASQAAAAKVIFTTEPPWQIPAGVKSSAMVDPKLFHKNGALLFRILVRKHLYDQKPVDEKASRIYTLVRRYFHLDREQLLFTVQRDELVQVEAFDLDQAFEQAIGQINAREGTAGIVPDQGRTPGNEPYIGLHADRVLELPQLPSMDRMHLDADTFDILFEPEGGKFHGESYRYLHIDGHVFTAGNPPDQHWCFAMEDHYLEGAFLPPYEFTGRLLAFCLDRCPTDAGEITRECWLYRTDDGHYLLHAATDADYDSRVVYRNASARAILKRAERFLAGGATAQSAAFLCHAAQAMRLKTRGKGGRS